MNDASGKLARLPVPPIVKRVRVEMAREKAFRRFTDEFASWWPLAKLSVFRERSSSCAIEPRDGGQVTETSLDGTTSTWGFVEEWRPFERLVIRWHAGRDDAQAQRVELSFNEEADGWTVVQLVHSNWEALGSEGAAVRDAYDQGWPTVLARAFPEGTVLFEE